MAIQQQINFRLRDGNNKIDYREMPTYTLKQYLGKVRDRDLVGLATFAMVNRIPIGDIESALTMLHELKCNNVGPSAIKKLHAQHKKLNARLMKYRKDEGPPPGNRAYNMTAKTVTDVLGTNGAATNDGNDKYVTPKQNRDRHMTGNDTMTLRMDMGTHKTIVIQTPNRIITISDGGNNISITEC